MTARERKQKAALREKGARLTARLRELYPAAECALVFEGDPFRLLIMAMLSAQCTDKRVNEVSVALFDAFPDARAMAAASQEDVEHYIRSCGLYRTKAKNLRAAGAILAEQYGGEVPSDMDALLALPGVGRKIANLIRGDVFGLPAVVTDTHCIRLAGRFGFCAEDERNPLRIERILCDAIEPQEQSDFCHRLVLFGREVCTARNPACPKCPVRDLCDRYGRTERKNKPSTETNEGEHA